MPPSTWQLQNAKNRFSALVKKALSEGPQWVTCRGEDSVVVLSTQEYRQLTRPDRSLSRFFKDSPLKGIDLDVSRQRDIPRKSHL